MQNIPKTVDGVVLESRWVDSYLKKMLLSQNNNDVAVSRASGDVGTLCHMIIAVFVCLFLASVTSAV